MEDVSAQTPEPIKNHTQQPKSGKGMILNLVLCFAAAAVVGVGVYFWQQQQVSDLSKKNDSLTSQLASAQKTGESSQPSGSSTSNTVTYKASVGKFTLTLPDKYAIIQRNDGGGEGGASTLLLIGDKTSKQGVVESSIWSSVTLTARGLDGQSFRSWVDTDLKEQGPYDKSIIKIDGVNAESYKVGGFIDPKVVYFSKGDLFYKITLDSMDASDDKLDAIIAGFKFD